MEHRRDPGEMESATQRAAVWRSRSDRELIVEMRRGISAAFDEFIARYAPLLRSRTGWTRLPEWEREDCVAEALETVILHLLQPEVRAPASMAAYLTRALRNRLTDAGRAREARTAGEGSGADRNNPAMNRVVTSAVSRYSVDACAPAGMAPTGLPRGLERLAAALVRPLTDEERLLVTWEGNMIPHRTIAAWLGISRAAATKRIWRLRTRLREAAAVYASSLPPREQDEIVRFVDRRRADPVRITAAAEVTRSSYQTEHRTRKPPELEERHDA